MGYTLIQLNIIRTTAAMRTVSCPRRRKTVDIYTLFVAPCISTIAVSAAFGAAMRNVPISELAAKADTIVVANAAVASQQGNQAVVSMVAIRVLKGNHATGTTLSVAWKRDVNASSTSQIQLPTALWFLQHNADGSWNVIPTVEGGPGTLRLFFKAAPEIDTQLTYSPETPISQKIVSEIASAIEYYNGAYADVLFFDIVPWGDSSLLEAVFRRFILSNSA